MKALILVLTGLFALVPLVQAQYHDQKTSTFTVYVYPASNPIDWSTPRGMLKDYFGLEMKSKIAGGEPNVKFFDDWGQKGWMSSHYISMMGHTITHTQCLRTDGKWVDKWSSFSGMDDAGLVNDKLYKEKAGVGVAIYEYKDGHIIAGEENWKRLIYYFGVTGPGLKQKVDPRYIEFEIDAKACDQVHDMIRFYEGFHHDSSVTYADLEFMDPVYDVLYFGPTLQPYESYMERLKTGTGKVGGGCAPYGVGLLKAAGRFEPEFDKMWIKPLLVSELLIGGTENEFGMLREVSLPQILFTDLGKYWTYKGVPNVRYDLYDPNLIWEFLGNTMSCMKASGVCDKQAGKWLAGQGSKVSRGPKHVFQNTVKNPVEGKAPTTTRRLEGVVVKM